MLNSYLRSKKKMKKILNYFEGELKNMLSQSIQAQ